MKVGGRRLSINSKHAHHPHVTSWAVSFSRRLVSRAHALELIRSEPDTTDTPASPPASFDDYPRPADHSQQQKSNEHEHEHEHEEHREGIPPFRKDKKHGHNFDLAGGDSQTKKGEDDTIPAREHHGHGGGKTFGTGGRIIKQPAGKIMWCARFYARPKVWAVSWFNLDNCTDLAQCTISYVYYQDCHNLFKFQR